MFQKETVLRKLQRVLSEKSNRLFDNQVHFYNAIFGMTNPERFPDALISQMQTPAQELPKQARQDIDTFFKSGLDNSSSNIGKHINDLPGLGIPKFHCVHYAQSQHKSTICQRLSAIIRYCTHRHSTDQLALLESLKAQLSSASPVLAQAETADEALLASVLYELVQTHLSERHSPELPNGAPTFGKVNMKQQIEEYFLTCDCYEVTSIDFFFALRRMADKNVIASSNLAGFYYVGMAFQVKNEGGGPHGTYVVERNLEQAAHYFHRAASCHPGYAPAQYSYGYMLLHGETGDLSPEQRIAETQHYYQLAAEQQFHHAVSGLGDLALLRADRLLAQPDPHADSVIQELAAAIRHFDRAQQMGSFWGPIKAAQFLANPAYAPYRQQALAAAGLSADQTARDRWKQAVDMGNVFAMDQLALLDLQQGHPDEARTLLEQAAQLNYPDAAYHLAQHFYSPEGLNPDANQHRICLEKAAYAGSAKASIALGKLALEESTRDPEARTRLQALAAEWFQKAEEQNFRCFDKDVHLQLRKYR